MSWMGCADEAVGRADAVMVFSFAWRVERKDADRPGAAVIAQKPNLR